MLTLYENANESFRNSPSPYEGSYRLDIDSFYFGVAFWEGSWQIGGNGSGGTATFTGNEFVNVQGKAIEIKIPLLELENDKNILKIVASFYTCCIENVNHVHTDSIVIENQSTEEKGSIYGIFVSGSSNNNNLVEPLIDEGAIRIRDALVSVIDDLKEGNTFLLNTPTVSQIEQKINDLNLRNGDTLIFYYTGHGGEMSLSGYIDELTETPGDEFLKINYQEKLVDDTLYSIFNQYCTGVTKWVILDSCKSGGFWSNKYEADGDLNLLDDILFISATTENWYTGSLNGTFVNRNMGFLTYAIIEGLKIMPNGAVRADSNKDNIITKDEWNEYLAEWSRFNPFLGTQVYELDAGDLVTLTPEMLHSTVEVSSDFDWKPKMGFQSSILKYIPAFINNHN